MDYGYIDMMTATFSKDDLRSIIRQHNADWDEAIDDRGGRAVMMFKLVEKTRGPWMGRVWRCEEMTQDSADARNAKIEVMQWEPC